MKVPNNYRDRKVCIMGMGYVGLTLALAMADAGFEISGIEINPAVLDLLRQGRAHFFETGLEPKLRRLVAEKRITFHQHIPPGTEATVFIITVGTPLGTDRKSRMDMIANVSREVATHLKAGDFVIMRSTVKLGTTRRIVLPILREKCPSVDLAFCPERTLEGHALQEIRCLPQIVGAATLMADVRASQLFQFVTPTVVHVSDVETAEMIKLVDNASRDVSFGFANEIALMCDTLGLSASEVIRCGKLGYPRTNLPMPGPVGGPCLEKDSHILTERLDELGFDAVMVKQARQIHETQPAVTVAYLSGVTTLLPGFPKNAPVISLLGLAFKGRPATDDLRGTMARPILAEIRKAFPNAVLRGFDAHVAAEAIRSLGLMACPTPEEAFAGAHLVLILNNHPLFANMPLETLAEPMAHPGLVYDYWNNFTASDLNLPPHVGYIGMGSHGKALLPASVQS
ncbi:MAG: nucleotide sugar dehydrogenase [Verrucomicrobiae bacterium]|nr:nucleotide sugar dehydrogenase [Verrucomicrobiae bacterium]